MDSTITPNTMEDQARRDDTYDNVFFRRKGVQPPASVYVTQDDTIELRAFSPTATTALNVSLRYLAPDGQIIPQLYQVSVTTIGAAAQVARFSPSEGFLLSASIEGTPGQRGFCYVSLVLIRGTGAQDVTFGQVLLQGYVPPTSSISFPQTPVSQGLDGRGALRALIGGAPAAGAEISDTVPAGRQWILRAARTVLVTAIAVANRDPSLIVDDGAGNVMAQSVDQTVIAATSTVALSWAAGFMYAAGTVVHSIPWVFECRLLPGWRIRTLTNAIQAADQYAAPVYMIEEFIQA